MPAARLGMWLFLSSEAMFFVGLLSAFMVLGAGAQHALFVKSSHMLSRWLGISSIICLILSSAAMSRSRLVFRWFSLLAAIWFLILQLVQGWQLKAEHTIVYRKAEKLFILEETPAGNRTTDLAQPFDIHNVTRDDFKHIPVGDRWDHSTGQVKVDLDYGPSRNNFFASYFLMSAAHIVHLLAGIIAFLWYMLVRKGKLPAVIQIYWHFVNAAGVVTILALYFV